MGEAGQRRVVGQLSLVDRQVRGGVVDRQVRGGVDGMGGSTREATV